MVPNIGPLIEHMRDQTSEAPNNMLKDMETNDGTWDLDAFRSFVLKEIIQKINSLIPHHPSTGLRKVRWNQIHWNIFD